MAEINLETYSDVSKELSSNPDDCHISSELNSDIHSMLNDILSDVSYPETNNSSETISVEEDSLNNEAEDTTQTQFEPRSTYFHDGHSYETDNNGLIYKKDGELRILMEFSIGCIP